MKRLETESKLKTSKEIRQARFARKQNGHADGDAHRDPATDLIIQSPQPLPFTHPFVATPQLTEDLPTALPLETLESLPPPLHSTPTPSPNTPPDVSSALVDDLDWNEIDWSSSSDEAVSQLSELKRIRGHAEQDEEEDFHSTMDVFAVSVDEPSAIRLVLTFVKDMDFAESSMRHLKRVTKRTDENGHTRTSIALCTTSYLTSQAMVSQLSNFHSTLATLQPYVALVPRTAARNNSELKIKAKLWPVVFSPSHARPTSSSDWPTARKAWVKAGMNRAISLALASKTSGDLPVGVFCTPAPESQWPLSEGFIPPTPGLRAASTDTRISSSHPLRHSVLNCVRSVAYLRTVPPFSEMQPTRNGADYLLTSLSLFITHEPCVMCTMALLHSRVREVFYIFPRARGGGFGEMGVHGRKDLNHRFEVWQWNGELSTEVREALAVDDSICI